MIENHLYSLVTVVKYKLLPCLLAIFLTGCDRTEVTLSFTPEMASFSNEFDFDPLRGPVKDFTQTLMDEQGEVTKRVSGTLSEEGCFDSLELLDLENNTVVALVLDANYYRDGCPDTGEESSFAGKMPASRITFCRGELGNR